MSLDSLSLALTQIQYLVNSLNKKNYLQSRNRYLSSTVSFPNKNCQFYFIFSLCSICSIEELIAVHGSEAERHLLCCCLAVVDFVGLGNGSSKDRDKEQLQLLADHFGRQITQPAFASLLNSALEQPVKSNSTKTQQPKNSLTLLNQFCRLLRLSRSQEVVLRIALLGTSNADLRTQSASIIRQKLGELFKNFAEQERNTAPFEGGLQVFTSISPFLLFSL